MSARGDGGARFEVLAGPHSGVATAAERRYGGPLRFAASPRPYVIANFVASIDGVASLGITDGTDSSTLSVHSEADRYLMAMLRSAADVVLIGAGNLRDTPGHQWVPAGVASDEDAMAELAAYRAALHGSPPTAPLVVVSSSGRLPRHVALDHPATRALVLTGHAGAARVRAEHPAVEVVESGGDGRLTAGEIVDAVVGALGPGLVLCEGGPSLMGALVAAGKLDELFLTISPRLAGRDREHRRPGVVEGWAADATALPGATLASARRAHDHLFLRYEVGL